MKISKGASVCRIPLERVSVPAKTCVASRYNLWLESRYHVARIPLSDVARIPLLRVSNPVVFSDRKMPCLGFGGRFPALARRVASIGAACAG